MKNNKLADKFRDEGNQKYKEKDFYEALKSYNKSFCYVEPLSDRIPLVFANRSAVYLEVNQFENCLENIELARSNGFKNETKLKEREEKCLRLMETYKPDPDEDPWRYFKLSYSANEKIPFIADCLELRQNKKFGRYVVTNRNLKPGDIVGIEVPAFKVIHEEGRYSNCANCLSENMLNLIPCNTCVHTMYCSDECLEDSKKFHKIECKSISAWMEDHVDYITMNSLKVYYELLKIAGSDEKLKAMAEDTKKYSVFDFDWNDMSEDEKQLARLKCFLSLSHLEINDSDILMINYIVQKYVDSAKTDTFIAKMICRIRGTFNLNNFGASMTNSYFKDMDKTVGTNLSIFMSLLNHSCLDNSFITYVSGKTVLIIKKPIFSGEQIFINYGCLWQANSLKERTERLQNYKFTCDCKACVHDYKNPMRSVGLNTQFIKLEYSESKRMHVIKQMLKETFEFMGKFANLEPCTELEKAVSLNVFIIEEINNLGFFPRVDRDKYFSYKLQRMYKEQTKN